jgi:hypothetical protein
MSLLVHVPRLKTYLDAREVEQVTEHPDRTYNLRFRSGNTLTLTTEEGEAFVRAVTEGNSACHNLVSLDEEKGSEGGGEGEGGKDGSPPA